VRVIYLAGSMRSGTTLLAELMGSCEGAIAVGEINNLWYVAPSGQRCSCGQASEACPVWGPVLEMFGGPAAAESYHAMRMHIERQRRIPQLWALRRRRESSWPAEVAEYVAMLRGVVGSIGKTTGAVTLVDSSKTAPGLALMCLAAPDEVSVLHLLRDPRGVAYSEQRHIHASDELTSRPPLVRSVLKSAKDWDTGNAECWLLGRTVEHYHRVWYEDLCAQPRAVTARAARALALDDAALSWTGNEVVLSAGHVLSGNPSRIGPRSRKISPDDTWRSGLPKREAVTVGAVTWPVKTALRRSA
jgi:hypothetical protein